MKPLLLAALAALLLPLAASAADATQLVDVVATGHGSTVREATKAALRAAVEQVVGTMVDATTLVENDALIEDEILQYSAGMVESAKQIGEPKKSEDGFYTVKVKATVRKGKLEEKLRTASAVSVALDGADLFARMTAAQDNLADAEAMIKDVLAKHISCVVAEAVPGKTGKSPLDLDPKTGEVFANVRVRIDMAKYQQFAKEVLEKLGPMAEKQSRISNEGDVENGRFSYSIPSSYPHFDNCLIIMGTFRTGSATVLAFDKNRMSAIITGMNTGALAFEVTLLDTAGAEMATKAIAINEQVSSEPADWLISLFKTYERRTTGLVAPMFGTHFLFNEGPFSGRFYNSSRGRTDETFHVSLGTFTADELKTAGKLEIRVGHMKDGQFVE